MSLTASQIDEVARLAKVGAALEHKLGRRVEPSAIDAVAFTPPARHTDRHYTFAGHDDWTLAGRGGANSDSPIVCVDDGRVWADPRSLSHDLAADPSVPQNDPDAVMRCVRRNLLGLRRSAYGLHFGYLRRDEPCDERSGS